MMSNEELTTGPNMFSGAAQMWKDIATKFRDNVNEDFFSQFRDPDSESLHFATWPPKEPTYRYFLTLIFNAVRTRDEKFFSNLRSLGNTTLGNPLGVKMNGVEITLDYLLSLEEFDFLESVVDIKNITTAVEIGAGFGRTAHTLIKLIPKLDHYTIIDLEPVLEISRGYLSRVIPDQFDKLNFVAAHDEDEWKNIRADIAINVDSFQEMPSGAIDNYRDNLLADVPIVYIKNPVCKYNPELLGIAVSGDHDVFSLGYMTEMANIFDEDDLIKMRQLYGRRYCPSPDHDVISSTPSDVVPYYQHILYKTS
jgi:hypothetical protein